MTSPRHLELNEQDYYVTLLAYAEDNQKRLAGFGMFVEITDGGGEGNVLQLKLDGGMHGQGVEIEIQLEMDGDMVLVIYDYRFEKKIYQPQKETLEETCRQECNTNYPAVKVRLSDMTVKTVTQEERPAIVKKKMAEELAFRKTPQ